MSLILEALRKSEAERRRGEPADLLRADVFTAPALPPLVAWRWLLPLALLLALALLAWWRHGPAPAAPAAQARVAAARRVAPADTRPPAGRLPPVPHLQAPASPPPAPPPRAEHLPAQAALPATPEALPVPAATPGVAATADPADRDIVALGALSPEQRKGLPPLRLSMHLWNADPARRIAVLDGRRAAVGDRLGEATVAEIRRDGVLLQWQGMRVLVPLP